MIRAWYWQVGVGAALIVMAGTGSAAADDKLCREIASFANASTDIDVIHSVELLTDWGDRFNLAADDDEKDEKDEPKTTVSLYAKTCSHHGYGPGRSLCGYLVDHTVNEFMEDNVRNVLSCIGPDYESFMGPKSNRAEYLTGKVSYAADEVDENVMVSVEWAINLEDRPSSLKIAAERVKARPQPPSTIERITE